MSDDIHELVREIDKAIEQCLAVGAREEHLSLKLPKAARPALDALCNIPFPEGRSPPEHYRAIPITEWTDGPFMSFSLDHTVLFDHTMPTTFHGKGVHDMVVELRTRQDVREWKPGDSPVLPEYRVTGESKWTGEDGVTRIAPEFERVGTKTSEHNFSTAHAPTIERVRELLRTLTAYQWGGKFWRVQEVRETFPDQADVRSIEVVGRPASYFDLEGWIKDDIRATPIEADCPALPIAPIPRDMLRPSIISKLISRRRSIIARARKPISESDASVHTALSAMSGKGRRANEL